MQTLGSMYRGTSSVIVPPIIYNLASPRSSSERESGVHRAPLLGKGDVVPPRSLGARLSPRTICDPGCSHDPRSRLFDPYRSALEIGRTYRRFAVVRR